MIKIFTIIFFAFSLAGCSQEMGCKQVRSGVFKTQTQSAGLVQVERRDNLHIETIPSLNKQSVYFIKWIDDCNFTLVFKSGDRPPGPDADKSIKCKIMRVNKNFHIVRAQVDGAAMESEYKMIPVK